jgi:ubiquinone/menaquinone biosynthesis C-methylase UbiE
MSEELKINTQNYVKDVYEKIASQFNDKRFSQWDWIEKFLDTFPEGSLVYDIGCGPGRNIRTGMIGVDNCQNFLKICEEKNRNAIYGDMISLPLESNSGVGMICIAAFHHLYNRQDRVATLSEFKRVLKPGSRIMLSIWSFDQGPETKGNRKLKFTYGDNLVSWNSKGEIYQRYYYIFRIEEIKELFDLVGLQIIQHFWEHGNEIFILET